MGVARVATQNGEQERAQSILVGRGIGTREPKGGLVAKIHPPPAGVEELGEENQLAQRRHWSRVVPLDMVASALGVNNIGGGALQGIFSSPKG
jgi:hypothetical protein